MPSAKPRYNAPPSLEERIKSGAADTDVFTEKLRSSLRGSYQVQNAEEEEIWGHPADDFVNEVLVEASWAVNELSDAKLALTKEEIKAERDDLLKTLTGAAAKLRKLSPEFDRLLGIEADPLGTAEKLEVLTSQIHQAELPKKDRADAVRRSIATEMSIRVLRVLVGARIRPAATGDAYFGYTSAAVEILKAIGDEIGLVYAPLTWRDIIISAQKGAPDLRTINQ